MFRPIPAKLRGARPAAMAATLCASLYLLNASAAAGQSAPAAAEPAPAAESSAAGQPASGSDNRVVRDGVSIELIASPAGGDPQREFYEGEYVDLGFRVTDAESGNPLGGLFPGAWMDIAKAWGRDEGTPMECKKRVGMYMQGNVGIRPLVDLNSYYLLVMNEDATISVIDPLVGISGITKLFATVILKRPGADWVKSEDGKTLYVTMPRGDAVAVVDTGAFKLKKNVPAGKHPVRIEMQPDGRYLWIGNDAKAGEPGGVTVLDAESLEQVASFTTGEGHHEIAFSDDSRHAYVSNRQSGTVSVIDTEALKPVATVATGTQPIAIAWSTRSKALYVADGREGKVSVIDGGRHEISATVQAARGLGPMGFSQDGRWLLVANTETDEVQVIDPATNTIRHSIAVGAKPFQIAFSRAFAYVRSIDTERVTMIELQHLGREGKPPVVGFAAGAAAPARASSLSISDNIAEAVGEAAVMVVSPADNTVYYYMEGMNAPMGNFRNYGHKPRAVTVVDRSLKERDPGVYTSRVRLPAPGTYDVAFLMESPQILHCFTLTAMPHPLLKRAGPPVTVDYLIEQRQVVSGKGQMLRFRLADVETAEPFPAMDDVRVRYYKVPGTLRTDVLATPVGEGVYEAELDLSETGAYYVYVSAPSQGMGYNDLPYLTLRSVDEVAGSTRPTRIRN